MINQYFGDAAPAVLDLARSLGLTVKAIDRFPASEKVKHKQQNNNGQTKTNL